ncbi:MAG: PQQ-binding-like beta-propeller repeat protein [Alphaproteobacteria bacterium]|nr:PQQ-binding-like beta-propeller repeat protein [Alphaproteobacteria bacterium]
MRHTQKFGEPVLRTLLIVGACTAFLTACSLFEDKDSAPLPGERLSVLELQKSLEPDDEILEAQGLIAPEEWRNDFWPQAGGYPNHSMQNLALGPTPLKKVWSVDIGQGTSDELPLVTQPIAVDGRIFTTDARNMLTAFDTKTGKQLWRRDISPLKKDDSIISGGLASSGGLLYATNGYNEVLAINPADGIIVWRKSIPAASRAAPTVMDNRIFITTLDSRLLALNTQDGALLWEYTGISGTAALVGAASAAANRDIVVPVFSSGEISALRAGNGSIAWSDNLSNVRGMGSLSEISDIRALPVIDKGIVVAISFSGRLAAIDERTGTRIWQREISGAQTPWLAGNHIFVLSVDNQLIALGRETGAIRWVTDLPRFDDKKPILFNGPVLAGGRLIVAGTGGRIIEVSPDNGKIIHQWSAGGTIALPPIIAEATLYLLAKDGTLSAYR